MRRGCDHLAGLGKALEAAQRVVEHGAPEPVEAASRIFITPGYIGVTQHPETKKPGLCNRANSLILLVPTV